MAQEAKKKLLRVKMVGYPHNGEGKPHLQFPDPITGEMIGGQVAASRMAMRYPHCVFPWARRQGKTKFRQYLLQNEALITSGPYWAGIVYPDHTTAAKVAENFIESWGGMVKDSHVNSQDQDRWVELYPFEPPAGAPPDWFTPRLKGKWAACQGGKPNTACKVYFWGGGMPHARKIQGFPHPFHRIDFDECQELESVVYSIVRPMLRDVRGHECFSGTPWSGGIGNVHFERLFALGLDPTSNGWFSYRITDGANPHVPPTNIAEARRSMSENEIRQTLYAEFLSDAGGVFSNLDAVFILKPLPDSSEALQWIRALRSRYAMSSMSWWVSEPLPVAGHIYGASIDWARSPKGDYSCIGVYDFSTGKQVCVVRWRGENFNEQMEVVLAIQQHYKASQLHSDANGMGEPMSDFLRRRQALGFVGHRFGRGKADYVRRGQILFREASVSLIDCAAQRAEFKGFSAFESEGLGSEKQVKYCAPEGEHDDFVASFLQVAPTMTICGRQDPERPQPEDVPMFDAQGGTTLNLFTEGLPLPAALEETTDDAMADAMTWDSVVLPKGRGLWRGGNGR